MMKKTFTNGLGINIVLALICLPAAADDPDTSAWVCEFCPFEDGYTAGYSVGVTQVSDDSAYIGDATGYDKEGSYVNLDGHGRYVADRIRMSWLAEDLGLDSRYVQLLGGRPGAYDFEISWRQIPRRQFDTTRSVFTEDAPGGLSLPNSWVRAPVTSGFAALAGSLGQRPIESDRSVLDAGGRYFISDSLSLSANYRRQQRDGVKLMGAPTFTNSSILPMPFDYSTEAVDVGLRYQQGSVFASLGWYLSDFESEYSSVRWQQPFSFSAPLGTDVLALAQAPDNRFQQLTLSAGYSFPNRHTVVSGSFAYGETDQDAPFLAYTTNSNLTPPPLPRVSLNGDVQTTNAAIALTSRPIRKSRVKLSYRIDKRDNKTVQDVFERVITDSILSGDAEFNLPYSFERGKLRLSADYDLFDAVRVSGGYDRLEVDRDFQEVASQTEETGWGQVRWRPLDSIEIVAKGGVAERDIDRYNETFAMTLGQNPLMRKYNLAYRYRRFGDLRFTWSPADRPLSIALSALFAEDDYTKSRIGIESGDELAVAADFSWSISDNTSFYLNAGVEELQSEQAASEQFGVADWRASHDDEFTTVSTGLRMRQVTDNVALRLDYTRSEGRSRIRLDSLDSGSDPFPDLDSVQDLLRLRLTYQRNERLGLTANLAYQRYEADDWSLLGVGPATIPVVLTLGAAPYYDEAIIVGIGVSYRLGEQNP